MNLNAEKNNVCPCCGHHCRVDALHCQRGMMYFGIETKTGEDANHKHHIRDKSDATMEDKVISLMRRCGHYLHHNMRESDSSEQMLSALSDDEKKNLILLLKKCLQNWE